MEKQMIIYCMRKLFELGNSEECTAGCSSQLFLPNCYHGFITLWSTLL